MLIYIFFLFLLLFLTVSRRTIVMCVAHIDVERAQATVTADFTSITFHCCGLEHHALPQPASRRLSVASRPDTAVTALAEPVVT